MTLNEIAYNIKNIVEEVAGEDSNLSVTQIKHMVHYHRAQLLLKYTDSGRYVSESMLQKDSYALNTSIVLPELIGFPNNRAIKEVVLRKNTGIVPENKKHNIVLINEADKEFYEASRFAPNKQQYFATINPGMNIKVFDNDGQLFVDGSYSIDAYYILANPRNSASYTSDATSRYPIPSELVSSLIQGILSSEFNVYLKTSTDYANDSVDEAGGKVAKTSTASQPNANARSRRGRTR